MDVDGHRLLAYVGSQFPKSIHKSRQKAWQSQTPTPALPRVHCKPKENAHSRSVDQYIPRLYPMRRWFGPGLDWSPWSPAAVTCGFTCEARKELVVDLEEDAMKDLDEDTQLLICAAGDSEEHSRSSQSEKRPLKEESASEDGCHYDVAARLAGENSVHGLPGLASINNPGVGKSPLGFGQDDTRRFTGFAKDLTEAINNPAPPTASVRGGENKGTQPTESYAKDGAASSINTETKRQQSRKRKSEPTEDFRCPFHFIQQERHKRCDELFESIRDLE
jgi:hypothetical protein